MGASTQLPKERIRAIAMLWSDFAALSNYQTSRPTGVLHGKRWRTCFSSGWYMGEYRVLESHPDGTVTYQTIWSRIIIKDRPQPEDGRHDFQKVNLNGQALPYNCHTFKQTKRTPPHMIVISGGQTGVDRGALDAAIELGILHAGWCPKGRLAEDGKIPHRYKLVECDGSYTRRTKLNVQNSQATVIIYRGTDTLGGGTSLTIKCCRSAYKPYTCVDINELFSEGKIGRLATPKFMAWILKYRVINFAGPRESKCPGIQEQTKALVLDLLERISEELFSLGEMS